MNTPVSIGRRQPPGMGDDGPMTVKHATSSVFVFARLPEGWRVGLISHPRFGNLMIPGGHVEASESQGEAALREVAEETGLAARLVPPPAAPLPGGYRATLAASPWWIAEYQVPADGHAEAAHVHVDHLYVAVADDPAPASEPEHPFGWHAADELPALRMFDDTRTLALAMLGALDGRPAPGVGAHADAEVAAALLAGLAG